MKIPLYICITSMVGVVWLTWFLRTKDMDFHPPGGIVAGLNSFPPTEQQFIGPPAPDLFNEDILPAEGVNVALDTFSDLVTEPKVLERMFAVLQADGDPEIIYLTGERMLECAEITPERKREVITRLREYQVSPWVYDTKEVQELSILATAPASEHDQIEAYLDELSQMVTQSSGAQVSLQYSLVEGEGSLSIADDETSALTLSSTASIQQWAATFYQLIRNQLEEKDTPITLTSEPLSDTETIQVAITRHAWALVMQ